MSAIVLFDKEPSGLVATPSHSLLLVRLPGWKEPTAIVFWRRWWQLRSETAQHHRYRRSSTVVTLCGARISAIIAGALIRGSQFIFTCAGVERPLLTTGSAGNGDIQTEMIGERKLLINGLPEGGNLIKSGSGFWYFDFWLHVNILCT